MTDRTHPDSGIPFTYGNYVNYAEHVQALQARVAELESHLEAIGAGGVTGPLIGQPQAMPDLTALTERGAKAWAGVDAQGLREGFTAADMATASAQGFRDGVASLAASAGSEPMFWVRLLRDGLYEGPVHHKSVGGKMLRDEKPGEWTPLYTHPSPPEGMAGWTTLPGQLPEPGTPVLLDIGKKYPIRAMWAPAKTLEASNDSDAVGDYDEATDTYYCPEGWYEWNQHEETHWFVTETPRAWMPLPASEAKEL